MFVTCPWCNGQVEILQFNCNVFRHGVYKATMQQLDSHASEDICLDAIDRQLLYGCGKPFKYNETTDQPEKCRYTD